MTMTVMHPMATDITPRDTLQQRYLRMTVEEKRQVIRDEAERLAEHYTTCPQDILPDVAVDDLK